MAVKYVGNETRLADWLEAEKVLAKSRIIPIPKGWITCDDYARGLNLSAAQARKRLRGLCGAGLAERKKWPAQGKNGQLFIFQLTKSRNGK